jgi:hypothetical protein
MQDNIFGFPIHFQEAMLGVNGIKLCGIVQRFRGIVRISANAFSLKIILYFAFREV